MRITALFLFLLMFSCSEKELTEEDIIGEWKVTDFEADMPGLSPFIIDSAEDLALSTVYTFKDDFTFEQNDDYGFSANGNWEYNLENKELVLIYPGATNNQVFTYEGNFAFRNELVIEFGTQITVIQKQ